MTFIHELHAQRPGVRLALWVLSVVTVLSVIGFFWFSSVQREMFFAMHQDDQERQQFLADREGQAASPFGVIADGFGALTARIGAVIGIDNQKGFQRQAEDVTTYLLPVSR